MNNIYDNDTSILGNVYNLKKYIEKKFKDFKDFEDLEEIKRILLELENYNDDTIIVIDYDYGSTGLKIDYWYKWYKGDIAKRW